MRRRDRRGGRRRVGQRRRPSRLSKPNNDQRQNVANRLLEQHLYAPIEATVQRLPHRQQEWLFYRLHVENTIIIIIIIIIII